MRIILFALLLSGCGTNDSGGNNCACTVTVDTTKANLKCGEQACVGGLSFGCDNDDVVSLGRCQTDFAVQPLRNDLGQAVCYPFGAACTTTLPCCGIDAGLTATCDPVSAACCVPTGSPCNTSSDCCATKACIPSGGQNVCGS